MSEVALEKADIDELIIQSFGRVKLEAAKMPQPAAS
jgi:hypothetical protein